MKASLRKLDDYKECGFPAKNAAPRQVYIVVSSDHGWPEGTPVLITTEGVFRLDSSKWSSGRDKFTVRELRDDEEIVIRND